MSDRDHYNERPQEVDVWLVQVRRLWSASVDVLERYLDRMNEDPLVRTKNQAKKRKTARGRR